jgi:hypothetical protein
MIVSIHQPNFIPWLGYFYKIYKSDVFVILDNVQFTKNGFTNRNRIKTPQGENWLTFPVIQSGKFGQDITNCVIFHKDQSARKIVNSVLANYKKSTYFDKYFTEFSDIIHRDTDKLCAINTELVHWILRELDIHTKVVKASELKSLEGESTERLVSICSELEATKYLAGLGAKKYQNDELFEQRGIELIHSPFKYPEYKQLWNGFIPNLSILDVIFNYGPDARQLLLNSAL